MLEEGVRDSPGASRRRARRRGTILQGFWDNFRHNLFKPLLLFFYLGFLVPLLKVEFEFPYAKYQGLTIYLLLAFGWHGGGRSAGWSSSRPDPAPARALHRRAWTRRALGRL